MKKHFFAVLSLAVVSCDVPPRAIEWHKVCAAYRDRGYYVSEVTPQLTQKGEIKSDTKPRYVPMFSCQHYQWKCVDPSNKQRCTLQQREAW